MIDFYEVDKYLSGSMTIEEKSAFEKKLDNDLEFKKEVEFYQQTVYALQLEYKHETQTETLKNTITKTSGKYFEKKEFSKLFILKKRFIAVSAIAASIILGVFIFYPRESLYEQYANHKTIYVQTKGDTEKDLQKGVEAFNSGNYKQAIAPLEVYLLESPSDIEIQLALGISFLEIDNYDQCLTIFSKEEFKESVFEDDAIWYSALTFLKKEEFELCKEQLLKIESDSDYNSISEKLYNRLEEE